MKKSYYCTFNKLITNNYKTRIESVQKKYMSIRVDASNEVTCVIHDEEPVFYHHIKKAIINYAPIGSIISLEIVAAKPTHVQVVTSYVDVVPELNNGVMFSRIFDGHARDYTSDPISVEKYSMFTVFGIVHRTTTLAIQISNDATEWATAHEYIIGSDCNIDYCKTFNLIAKFMRISSYDDVDITINLNAK